MKFLSSVPRNALLAALVVISISAWMISGLFTSQPVEKEAALNKQVGVSVITKPAEVQTYSQALAIVAKSAPYMEVNLAAQTAGDVKTLLVERGKTVRKGETLLQIDMATRNQELAAAKATLEAAKVAANTAQELFDEGFASETRLAQALAEQETAIQNVSKIEQDITYTTVKAPVNGIIEERLVDVGDYVGIGTPLFHIVNQDHFLITGFVAQKDRKHVHLGQKATATLANGQEVTGKMSFIATKANETTKTFRIDLMVDGKQYSIPTGMTANLNIPTEEIQAVKIQHSQLVLDADGTVGVMLAISTTDKTTQEETPVAQFTPVTMLQDAPQGIWVAGIPAGAKLIIRGHANVSTGTRLKVQEQPQE